MTERERVDEEDEGDVEGSRAVRLVGGYVKRRKRVKPQRLRA